MSSIDISAALPPGADYPDIPFDGDFSFRCGGCGNGCRKRNDIGLSGLDLWRLAGRLGLPTELVIASFGKKVTGSSSRIPVIRLMPRKDTGNCPFLTTRSGCAVHSHKPLVCALYPLGQSIEIFPGIDPSKESDRRKAIHYFSQDTGCSGEKVTLSLREYLAGFAIEEREELDLRWARDCLALSSRVKGLEKRLRPIEMKYLQRKIERALYLDYDSETDFAPQYEQNIAELERVLCKLEGDTSSLQTDERCT